MKTLISASLLVFSLVFSGFAQTPTIDQSLSMKSASNPRISPDGRFIAYQVQEVNWTDNAWETEIWIANPATGERFQLTNAKKSSSAPQWSPDGRRLAFVSDRNDKRQLYLISPVGGEAVQLTNVETGVNGFSWSPDGRRIAFTMVDPKSKARKEREEKYGEYEIVESDYNFTHLWMIDVADEIKTPPEAKRLTEGTSFTVGSFNWSPDATRIAFSATRDADLGSSHTADIYVLKVTDKAVKKIVETLGPDNNPIWSPDGKQIAFETANAQEFFYYLNSYLAVVSSDGGAPQTLSASFDEIPRMLAWSPDGIYFSAQQRVYASLFRLNPSTKAIEQMSKSQMTVAQVSFTKDFKQAAFIQAAANQYPEIFVSAVKPLEGKRLTAMGEQFKDFKLATREIIRWKSTDGTEIEGVLIKPANFDASKKYPLLVVIHGGPTGVDTPVLNADRTYPIEMFAAKGAVILRPNYRGSAGYGEKFRSLNVRNLGVGDYWDVISGVDFLIAQGLVDRDRVGSMGWSQGGYISAFITTSSDRFKAVSVGAGISNWMTYYVNTDIHPFTRQYLKATPWDDPEIYRKTSPISYVKSAQTPTLIQHGELDRRVPIPNAYELYQALKDKGVPVKLAVFKGFGHGIDKPKQQRQVMEQNYEWFSRYIWGEKPNEEGK
ncbi:MAG: S9 family peptidase [Acidobacteriota bacterium]